MASPPECIEDLKWLGINLVATANNHASDFGEAGIVSNLEHLDRFGVAHAGTGLTLTRARAPGYLETPRGRVALVASADWGPRGTGGHPWPFPMGVIAGEQSPSFQGRPGVNLIRHRTRFTVTTEVFQALREMSNKLRFQKEPISDSATEFRFQGSDIIVGGDFDLGTVAEQDDLEDNYRWVRDARRNADWVLYSFHNHGATKSPELPSDHTRVLAHGAIDNGADVFIGHGPHRDRGIEIYKGKPIFYSLGDFILQNSQVTWAPHDVMKRVGLGYEHTPADFHDTRAAAGGIGAAIGLGWESAVVTTEYEHRQLTEIKLYPVDLGIGLPRSMNGRPVLAAPGDELNARVLERFQSMSKPYGTDITIKDGVGIIRVG
jgi:poly-gamma-glutamate synthesis protein (capsule biosynthesis protein)